MPDNTIDLFPSSPLLQQRLGTERFDAVPQQPGVYRFFDERGELLYVGKAKNLRKRLFSYKRARAGQVSRKVSRMIGRIATFEIEVTETERDAFLLENRMIRGERPPFNHANKQTEAYYYVYLHPGKKGLEFRLAMQIHEETDVAFWHGCFKGHRTVRESFGCLLRLIWMAEHDIRSPMNLPVQLTRNLTPLHFQLPWHPDHSPALRDGLPEMLNGWIRGESCELPDWLIVRIECGHRLTQFQIRLLEIHLEILKRFYDHKLTPHRLMRGDHQIIPQEEVDDLMVTHFTISRNV